MVLTSNVEIVEVGPRDGLQSESHLVPTAVKVDLIERLLAAGVRRLEVANFVDPRKVPQMADAEQVLAELPARADCRYCPYEGGCLGGCPFAPGASGNIATEDLLYLLERSGFRSGISLSGVLDTSRWLQEQLGRPLPGMLMKAGTFPPAHPAPAP